MDALIKNARRAAKRLQQSLEDPRYRRVIGLLIAKGYLIADHVPPAPQAKVSVGEALWAAAELEPRVLEVLPAALIAFPKSFTGIEALPAELQRIIALLKAGSDEGPAFGGFSYSQFRRWTEHRPLDRRSKPLSQKRVTLSFRISRKAVQQLNAIAQREGVPRSHLIEGWILGSKP